MREYTDQQLLEIRELPCRVCGAPVVLEWPMRMRVLQRRIEYMQAQGWDTVHWKKDPNPFRVYYLTDDLAELRTLPGIICKYRAHANPLTRSATCAQCETSFIAQRSTARYCSSRCRVAAHRKRAGST